MDAVTSFELEAQRRRETIASDRGNGWTRAKASTTSAEMPVDRPVLRRSRAADRPAIDGECQPAPLAQSPVG